MKTVTYIKQQRSTALQSAKIVTKLTPKHRRKLTSCVMLHSYINGFDLLVKVSSRDRYSPVLLELRQFMSSKDLHGLLWSTILIAWLKEGNPNFPFEDEELLDLLQVRNEQTALKRLLQFIHKTTKT